MVTILPVPTFTYFAALGTVLFHIQRVLLALSILSPRRTLNIVLVRALGGDSWLREARKVIKNLFRGRYIL